MKPLSIRKNGGIFLKIMELAVLPYVLESSFKSSAAESDVLSKFALQFLLGKVCDMESSKTIVTTHIHVLQSVIIKRGYLVT